jgi:hypothetical protein
MTDEAIETLSRFIPQLPSPTTGVGLQHLHGAASRVDPSATAFPHRAEQYDFLILSQWPDAADSTRNIEFTRAFFEAMQPYLEDSVYVNNLGDEGQGRVQVAYGENYQRLATLKRKHDLPICFVEPEHRTGHRPIVGAGRGVDMAFDELKQRQSSCGVTVPTRTSLNSFRRPRSRDQAS